MTDCIKESAVLTSVHSSEEEDFLNELGGGNSYWIGGYPDGTTWFWVDYTDFDYTHDYSLDPSSDLCIYQPGSTYGNGWDDHSCDSSSYYYYYICKNM